MNTKKEIRMRLMSGVLAAGLPLTMFANGFRLPDQDAAATARGEAFVATADNPSAIYYNPAGITQLSGNNIRAGLYGLSFTTTYDAPAGGSYDTEDNVNLVPQVFYTYTMEELPLAFGLGAYAPFGMKVDWPQDTGFRTIALKSDLKYATVNPVVAWGILTNLSVAAGPTFNFSSLNLQKGITPFPKNDSFDFDGDGVAYGFNAGVMWKPIEQISLGLTYRSATTVDYDGTTKTKFVVAPPGYPNYLKQNASASVEFPQSMTVGLSYRPTPKWNLEFNADWTDWSSLQTVNVNQAVPVPGVKFDWQASWYYEFGVTRELGKGWRVSAGYIYNQNSMPSANYNPWVPDQARQFVSVGVGYQGEHLSFDVAYQYGFAATRTVSGSAPSAFGQTADGKYDYFSNAVSVSAGWHF